MSRLGEDPGNEDVLAYAELADSDFRCSIYPSAIGQVGFRSVRAVVVFSKSAFSRLKKREIKRFF